jgi:hypothetical protein
MLALARCTASAHSGEALGAAAGAVVAAGADGDPAGQGNAHQQEGDQQPGPGGRPPPLGRPELVAVVLAADVEVGHIPA